MVRGLFQHGRAYRAIGVRPSAFWLLSLAALLLPLVVHSESLLEAYVLAHDNDPKYRAAQADARVRADASHYLGLSGAAAARAWLEARLHDDDADVREIAAESLAALPMS